MKVLEKIFLSFFQASLTASITIVIIILILKTFKNHISVRVKHGLWILVVIRLLVPVIPEMNINILNILNQTYENSTYNENKIENLSQDTNVYMDDNIKSNNVLKNTSSIQCDNYEVKMDKQKLLSNTIKIFTCIWMLGSLFLLSIFSLYLFKIKKKVKYLEMAPNCKFHVLMNNLMNKVKINVNIPICICEDIKSPCILGIIKPKIYIPEYVLNIEDNTILSHILLHELMHYKRKDLYCNFLGIIALAIHWFNPFVWIAINKMKVYREYACDACVLEILGEEESTEYGMTLIKFSKMFLNKKNYSQLTICFETNNQIRGRIEMIKSFKKGSYKMSGKAILACLVATTVVFINGVTVNALDSSNLSANTNENQIINKDKYEFLIDSDLKAYSDINKVQKVSEFKFKLPDYILEGNELMCFHVIKLSGNGNAVRVFFDNEDKFRDKDSFTLDVFEEDPIESLKKINDVYDGLLSKNKKVEVEQHSMKVGEIEGESITLTSIIPEKEIQAIKKYFVWKNEGIWYSINYNKLYKHEGENNQFTDILEDSIGQIANSLKNIDEISGGKYTVKPEELSTERITMNIYDKEDLEDARKILGFNPKLPLKINNDIVIKDSVVNITNDSDVEKNIVNYEIDNFYSNREGTITFSATKHDPKYEDMQKNGYVIEQDADGKDKKINVEKLNINNKEVSKYVNNFEDHSGQKCNESGYMWSEDGIYYSVILFNATENFDEIAKEFVNSKSID